MVCAVSLVAAAQSPCSNSCQLFTEFSESGELIVSTSYDLTEESLIFDGDDFIAMASNQDMLFDSQMSLCAWVRIPQNPNYWNTLFGGYYDYGINLYAGSNNSGGAIRIELPGVLTLTGEIDLRDNQWHHVSVVYDGSQLTIWIDGIIDVSQNASGGIQIPNTTYAGGEFYLGRGNHTSEFFIGDMAYVSLWDIALTPEEIQQQRQCHRALSEDTAVAHWEFEEDEGTVVMDFSGGGNHGEVNGAVFSSDMPIQACYSISEVLNLCGPGTIWDSEMQMCIGDGSGDINLDGCVQLNDLLDLLSAYGDCGAEESPWQCGDPLEYQYQGHNYQTVQIGDQCWFAENLRSANYRNGDVITPNLNDGQWNSLSTGAKTVYGEGPNCNNASPIVDACDPVQSYAAYGHLYNWYAVDDARGLCPSGWSVPAIDEFHQMVDFLALDVDGNEGLVEDMLKDVIGWSSDGNGNNTSGFSAIPGGYRMPNGSYTYSGSDGSWWSASPSGSSGASLFNLSSTENDVDFHESSRRYGFSVRCIKDIE